MKSRNLDPMQVGYLHAKEGGELSENPYDLDDVDRYFDWVDGFIDAQIDMDRDKRLKEKWKDERADLKDILTVVAVISLMCIILLCVDTY